MSLFVTTRGQTPPPLFQDLLGQSCTFLVIARSRQIQIVLPYISYITVTASSTFRALVPTRFQRSRFPSIYLPKNPRTQDEEPKNVPAPPLLPLHHVSCRRHVTTLSWTTTIVHIYAAPRDATPLRYGRPFTNYNIRHVT